MTVNVFLKEALTSNSTSVISGDGGLAGAGFSATRSASLPASPASLTAIAGSVSSNGSNFPGGSFTPKSGNSASFMAGDNTVNISANSGPVPNASDAGGVDLIQIGSLTITAGTSGTTSFTLANFKYPLTSGGFTQSFNTGYDLDVTKSGNPAYTGASANPEVFNVTVLTPEPASLALLALGGGGLLLRRRRMI